MRKIASFISLFLGLAVIATMTGCGGGTKLCKQQDIHDTPENHYFSGRRTIERAETPEQIQSAQADFDRALCLDPTFPPAAEGLGLVQYKLGNPEAAKEQFNAALTQNPDWIPAYIGLGRVALDQGNYAEAHQNFEEAAKHELSGDSGITERLDERTAAFHDEARYYNGLTYHQEGDYENAQVIFTQMREQEDLTSEYQDLVLQAWEKNKIAMMEANNRDADYVAIMDKDSITRQDLAAVLFTELPADKIYAVKVDQEMMRDIQDIDDTWAKDEIKKAVESKMMNLPPNGMFNPADKVSKADVAQALAQSFSNARNDDNLMNKYDGQETPFYDVLPSHPNFNAIMFVAEEGLMGPQKGTFGFSANVSGSQIFWIMYNANEKLK